MKSALSEGNKSLIKQFEDGDADIDAFFHLFKKWNKLILPIDKYNENLLLYPLSWKSVLIFTFIRLYLLFIYFSFYTGALSNPFFNTIANFNNRSSVVVKQT